MTKWLIVILVVFDGIAKLIAGFIAGGIGATACLGDEGPKDPDMESLLKEATGSVIKLFLVSLLGDAAVFLMIGLHFG